MELCLLIDRPRGTVIGVEGDRGWCAAELVEDVRGRRVERQSEPRGASARTGWPVTSAISSMSRS